MKTPILLHIPEPCHENWDAMTPQDKGRNCQSCNKIVVDFSVMSDRQVLEYFKTTTGKTCGRFHDDQLQRPLVEPQQKSTKWNYFIASILGFIVSNKTMAQGKILTGKVIEKPVTTTRTLTTKVDVVKAKRDSPYIQIAKDTLLKKSNTVLTNLGDTLVNKKVNSLEQELASKNIVCGKVGGVRVIEYQPESFPYRDLIHRIFGN